MATYKESVGTAVRDIAGEDGVVTGQLWYDTDANEYKYRQQFKGNAWSSANAMNTGRFRGGGAGTQTAALAFTGYNPPTAGNTVNAEYYDGSSWTEVANVNTARTALGSDGTQTSALGFGGTTGVVTGVTESWNGSAWTEVADLNTC